MLQMFKKYVLKFKFYVKDTTIKPNITPLNQNVIYILSNTNTRIFIQALLTTLKYILTDSGYIKTIGIKLENSEKCQN